MLTSSRLSPGKSPLCQGMGVYGVLVHLEAPVTKYIRDCALDENHDKEIVSLTKLPLFSGLLDEIEFGDLATTVGAMKDAVKRYWALKQGSSDRLKVTAEANFTAMEECIALLHTRIRVSMASQYWANLVEVTKPLLAETSTIASAAIDEMTKNVFTATDHLPLLDVFNTDSREHLKSICHERRVHWQTLSRVLPAFGAADLSEHKPEDMTSAWGVFRQIQQALVAISTLVVSPGAHR